MNNIMYFFSMLCLIVAMVFLAVEQMDYALLWLGLAIYNKIPVEREDD